MGNKTLNRIVTILIIVAMVGGLLFSMWIMVNVDVAMRRQLAVYGKPAWMLPLWYVLCSLFLAGAEAIAVQLLCMMRSVEKDPFVLNNVRVLHRMGMIALGMAVIGFVLSLYPLTAWLTAAISAIVLLCGLFSLVLSEVFAAAVAHKQELDLTI